MADTDLPTEEGLEWWARSEEGAAGSGYDTDVDVNEAESDEDLAEEVIYESVEL